MIKTCLKLLLKKNWDVTKALVKLGVWITANSFNFARFLVHVKTRFALELVWLGLNKTFFLFSNITEGDIGVWYATYNNINLSLSDPTAVQ